MKIGVKFNSVMLSVADRVIYLTYFGRTAIIPESRSRMLLGIEQRLLKPKYYVNSICIGN